MKQDYCLGFLFNADGTEVALIKKKRPEWMAEKWNGIGGKIDHKEQPLMAMNREFKEETGVDLTAIPEPWQLSWIQFAVLSGEWGRIFCYTQFANVVYNIKTMTDEQVGTVEDYELKELPMVENTRWLIELARSFHHNIVPTKYNIEQL